MRRIPRVLLVMAVTLLPSLAAAQARVTGADLEGTLRDDTGAVLAGANVTATNVETAVERSTATDVKGRYMLAALPPGVYRVSAELFGFGGQTREHVTLLLGQAARVDFALRLAGRGGDDHGHGEPARARRPPHGGRLRRRVAADPEPAHQRPQLHQLLADHARHHLRPLGAAA